MKHLFLLWAVVFLQSVSLTQTIRTFLHVSDAGGGSDTLWFGYAPGATCGADFFIPCEWIEPPPPPPGVLDVRWLSCPPGQGGKCDIRAFMNPADIDTHKVRFLPGDAGFPVTFQWSPDSIRAICDSAWLQDEFGGVIFRVRMHVDSLYTFAFPAFNSALVIRFGQRPPLSVEQPEQPPFAFRLEQNFPNPFNPSTKFEFRITESEFVSLKVFDVLGRKVATLVDEYLLAGDHSVTFNGENLASGVYVYTLLAKKSSQSRKMIVLK